MSPRRRRELLRQAEGLPHPGRAVPGHWYQGTSRSMGSTHPIELVDDPGCARGESTTKATNPRRVVWPDRRHLDERAQVHPTLGALPIEIAKTTSNRADGRVVHGAPLGPAALAKTLRHGLGKSHGHLHHGSAIIAAYRPCNKRHGRGRAVVLPLPSAAGPLKRDLAGGVSRRAVNNGLRTLPPRRHQGRPWPPCSARARPARTTPVIAQRAGVRRLALYRPSRWRLGGGPIPAPAPRCSPAAPPGPPRRCRNRSTPAPPPAGRSCG